MLALSSAMLHVAWNAVVRAAAGSLAFVACQLMAGALAAGLFAALAGPWRIPGAVWPLVLSSVAVHAVYFRALAAAYRQGTLSTVYPAARGLGIMVTTPLAAWLLSQHLPLAGWMGIVLVTLGVAAPAAGGVLAPRAQASVLAVGLAVGLYSLVDSHAVSLVSPAVYISLQFAGTALVMLPGSGLLAWARRAGIQSMGMAAVAGVGTWASYLLLLYAFRLAPAGPVLALRQAAPALAPVLGSRWLGERHGRPRWAWAGALAVAAGGALAAWH